MTIFFLHLSIIFLVNSLVFLYIVNWILYSFHVTYPVRLADSYVVIKQFARAVGSHQIPVLPKVPFHLRFNEPLIQGSRVFSCSIASSLQHSAAPRLLMKIAVVGCGAVGQFYAAQLSLAGHDIRLLARRDAATIADRGIIVHQTPTPKVKSTATYSTLHIAPERLTVATEPLALTTHGFPDWVLVALKTTAHRRNDALPSEFILLPFLREVIRLLDCKSSVTKYVSEATTGALPALPTRLCPPPKNRRRITACDSRPH
jgi:hypothetical protein